MSKVVYVNLDDDVAEGIQARAGRFGVSQTAYIAWVLNKDVYAGDEFSTEGEPGSTVHERLAAPDVD